MVPGHIRLIARRKVLGFILSEEGRVGSRTALSTATLVAVSSLAAMLLMPLTAKGWTGYCPNPNDPNGEWCYQQYCCNVAGRWFCSSEFIDPTCRWTP